MKSYRKTKAIYLIGLHLRASMIRILHDIISCYSRSIHSFVSIFCHSRCCRDELEHHNRKEILDVVNHTLVPAQ